MPDAMNTTDTVTDLAAILEQAADYLDAHGWCQGELYEHGKSLDDYDLTPGACALGALYISVWGAPISALCHIDPAAFRRAEAAAALVVDTLALVPAAVAEDEQIYPADELIWWNDGTDRTAQQVVDTFRRIAACHRRERAS